MIKKIQINKKMINTKNNKKNRDKNNNTKILRAYFDSKIKININ